CVDVGCAFLQTTTANLSSAAAHPRPSKSAVGPVPWTCGRAGHRLARLTGDDSLGGPFAPPPVNHGYIAWSDRSRRTGKSASAAGLLPARRSSLLACPRCLQLWLPRPGCLLVLAIETSASLARNSNKEKKSPRKPQSLHA